MALPIPNLDDKTFEQLIEEAKKLIPLYAPKWTDQNIHDPGITLLELFAWLAETQFYSLNRINDKNYIKYLKLLGVSQLLAGAAKVDITVRIKDSSPNESIIIKAGHKAIARDPHTQEKIVFETAVDIEIIGADLKKIIVNSNYKFEDVTDFNKPNKNFFYTFGTDAKIGSIMYLGFDNLLPGKSLNFKFYIYERDLPPVGRHDGEDIIYRYEETVAGIRNGYEELFLYPSATVKWEYLGKKPIQAEPLWYDLNASTDETISLTKSGRVSFTVPSDMVPDDSFKDVPDTLTQGVNYWIRCRVTAGSYEIPPRIERILINTVSAIHGEKIQEEILFDEDGYSGTGLPDQIYETVFKPVIPGSQAIYVMNEKWVESADFDSSGPEGNHYRIDYTNGKVIFGDGISGKVPPLNSNIKIQYRFGGGEKGNIRENDITELENLDDIEAVNWFPASGGREAETIEDTVIRTRKGMQVTYNAVTLEDFERIAILTPGLRVARAKAILDIKTLNTVIVVVVPYSLTKKPPLMSDGFSKTVCCHIDKHGLITTDISIVDPCYVSVSISASIKIKAGFNADYLRQRCIDSLNRFLSPIRRAPGDNEWPFGRPVYRSEVFEVLEDTEGLDGVMRLTINGNFRDFFIGETALVFPGEHHIEVIEPHKVCREKS